MTDECPDVLGAVKEYLKQTNKDCRDICWGKVAALENKMDLHMKLNQIALDKAASELNERLGRMNEFRDALKDQADEFVTEAVYESRHQTIQLQVDTLRLTMAKLEGKASATSVYWAYALGIVAIIINVFEVITK